MRVTMGVLKYVFVVILFVGVVCEEKLVEEKTGEKARTLVDKDFQQNRWRAVEPINMETSGWIPDDPPIHEPNTDTDNIPKRRRLRKRKRRPPIIPLSDENPEISMRRIRRPQLLNEDKKPWKEMEQENRERPNKRRRIIPVYMDDENPTINQHFTFGDREIVKIPDAEVGVFQADEGVPENKNFLPDLKMLLKQAGGSSLSEILQQKNLSLNDLLTGQRQAILALTEKPPNDVITEYKNPVEMDDFQKPTSNEVYKANPNEDSAEQSVKGHENAEETVTERIFVPSHPMYYTSLDYKPSINKINLVGSEVTSNTNVSHAKEEKPSEDKPDLPITNAQMHKRTRPEGTMATHANDFISAYAINITDLFGFENLMKQQQNESANNDEDEGPIRMSINLNEISENEAKHTTEKIISSTAMVIPEKMKAITAKDELMDILQDESAKRNLSKILATRNMTIEELVEQRERGSSQKHLADIFHNKTKEPEPKVEAHTGQVIPMTYTYRPKDEVHTAQVIPKTYTYRPFAYFERKPKSHFPPLEMKKDSEGHSYVTSVDAEIIEDSNESKSIEESKDKDKYTVTSFPTYKIEMDRKFKDPSRSALPLWKTMYPIDKDVIVDEARLQKIDVIENTISEAVNDKLNVDITNDEVIEDDYDDSSSLIELPYGVKSAILASLLIIGSSLLLFLTILVIFKWSQRHKKKLCNANGWSCSKIKSPILDETPKRSLRSFMFETLGRSKVYYKQPLRSTSDSIWDNDKKPFQ